MWSTRFQQRVQRVGRSIRHQKLGLSLENNNVALPKYNQISARNDLIATFFSTSKALVSHLSEIIQSTTSDRWVRRPEECWGFQIFIITALTHPSMSDLKQKKDSKKQHNLGNCTQLKLKWEAQRHSIISKNTTKWFCALKIKCYSLVISGLILSSSVMAASGPQAVLFFQHPFWEGHVAADQQTTHQPPILSSWGSSTCPPAKWETRQSARNPLLTHRSAPCGVCPLLLQPIKEHVRPWKCFMKLSGRVLRQV